MIPDESSTKSKDLKPDNNNCEKCCEKENVNNCPEAYISQVSAAIQQQVVAEAESKPLLSPEVKAEILEYVHAFAVAIVLAAFIITFIAQSFVVEGSSMEPSLHNRERLLVNKFVYRFKKPEYGDVVVFRYPANPKRRFIKRVIGVPGDQVEIRDGFVVVNNNILNEDYTLDLTYGYFGPKIVPEEHYFVLGDNRNNSDDSRYPDVGFVPKSNIVGKAALLWWPFGRFGTIKSPEASF